MGNHIDSLRRLGACFEATQWAESQPDAETAWRQCPRGDWLLWAAARLDIDRKLLVRAACACARTALPRVPAGEERPRIAIEMAEAWSRGETTLYDVLRAAQAASAAASAAADAAYAAADAADAAYAAAAAADDAARSDSLARSADIVREILPWEAMSAKLEDK